jgi:hypothetical protein
MEIHFVFSDVVFSPFAASTGLSRVEAFRFTVEVKRDPSAITAFAEQVAVDPPSRASRNSLDCRHVRLKHIPGVITTEYIERNGLGPPYPRVRAAQFAGIISNRKFLYRIKDTAGREAYAFQCLDTDLWGIECGLYLPRGKVNLLGESVDVYSRLPRSTVLPEQLEGSCAGYPDWGARRIFRLRHLRIELILSLGVISRTSRPLESAAGGRTEISVSTQIEPDPSAESPVAPPPDYAYWGYLPIRDGCATPIPAPHGSGDRERE